MSAFGKQFVLVAAVALWLSGCGGGEPSHAGLENLPADRPLKVGGEDRVSVADANAISVRSSAPDETQQSYREALVERMHKAEARLADGADSPYRSVVVIERQLLEAKIDSLDFSYERTRELRDAAHLRVRAFLIRFASGLQWEADFAMQSGDLDLVSALVQDVVDKMRRRMRLSGRLTGDGPGVNPGVPAVEELTAAEKRAAETFLAIGQLAQDEALVEAAELNYRLARAYNPDMNVATEAAAAQIALLRAMGRQSEAAKIEAEVTEMLTR